MTMEKTLLICFQALEEKAIRYALLRGFEELSRKTTIKEVDLLVERSQLDHFARVIGKLGFRSLPSWGYEPHHFFVAYDSLSNRWIKLDVVTELVYGAPVRWLKVDFSGLCLTRRQRKEPTYVLAPADEFVSLLLHCLLDKGRFREQRRNKLTFLHRQALDHPEIANDIEKLLQAYFPSSLNRERIFRYIEENRWDKLISYRRRLTGKLFRIQPFANLTRYFTTRLMRRLRPLMIAFTRQYQGLWVAFLAPDGGGKTTLVHSLLKEQFLRASLIYMGTNPDSSTVGFPTTFWLKKQLRRLEANGGKFLLKPLKAIAYLNRLLEQWYRVISGLCYKIIGRTVVFDRFIYDSSLAAPPRSTGQRIRRWLMNHTCPRADLTFLLDAPGEVLYRRKGEHSPAVLERQRQIFLQLETQIPNMQIVDATQSAEEVRSKVLEGIWRFYGSRQNGKGREIYGCKS